MSYLERIQASENQILYGNILIKGTKVSVGSIIRELSKGISVEEIIKKWPEISTTDVYACLEYAAELVAAIDFKKAKAAIDVNIKKRYALANRIRSLKDRPFIFKDENGNTTDLSKL